MQLVSWLNLVSLIGCVAFAVLAWLLGGCKRPVPWKTVTGSGARAGLFYHGQSGLL